MCREAVAVLPASARSPCSTGVPRSAQIVPPRRAGGPARHAVEQRRGLRVEGPFAVVLVRTSSGAAPPTSAAARWSRPVGRSRRWPGSVGESRCIRRDPSRRREVRSFASSPATAAGSTYASTSTPWRALALPGGAGREPLAGRPSPEPTRMRRAPRAGRRSSTHAPTRAANGPATISGRLRRSPAGAHRPNARRCGRRCRDGGSGSGRRRGQWSAPQGAAAPVFVQQDPAESPAALEVVANQPQRVRQRLWWTMVTSLAR